MQLRGGLEEALSLALRKEVEQALATSRGLMEQEMEAAARSSIEQQLSAARTQWAQDMEVELRHEVAQQVEASKVELQRGMEFELRREIAHQLAASRTQLQQEAVRAARAEILERLHASRGQLEREMEAQLEGDHDADTAGRPAGAAAEDPDARSAHVELALERQHERCAPLEASAIPSVASVADVSPAASEPPEGAPGADYAAQGSPHAPFVAAVLALSTNTQPAACAEDALTRLQAVPSPVSAPDHLDSASQRASIFAVACFHCTRVWRQDGGHFTHSVRWLRHAWLDSVARMHVAARALLLIAASRGGLLRPKSGLSRCTPPHAQARLET